MRQLGFIGLVLWTSLGIGCSDKKPERPSREECMQVAEHIAGLIVADMTSNPDQLWDALHEEPGDSGIPADVQKPAFKLWLDTAPGKTWLMQRHGQTLAGTQEAVGSCVEQGSKPLVQCLMKATSKDAVIDCDKRFARPDPKAPASSTPEPTKAPVPAPAAGSGSDAAK